MSGNIPMTPMTRRTLVALLSAGVASGVAPAAQPMAAAAMSEASAALRRNSEAINKVDVPPDAEPAFRFQP